MNKLPALLIVILGVSLGFGAGPVVTRFRDLSDAKITTPASNIVSGTVLTLITNNGTYYITNKASAGGITVDAGANITLTTNGTVVTIAGSGSGGGATNGIQQLNGTGTNTTLVGLTGTGTNAFHVTSANTNSVTNNLRLDYVTASRVAIYDAAKGVTNSAGVDTTELEYLNGVTSALQTQLDAKQPLDTQLTELAGLSSTNQLVGQSQLIAATNVLGTAAYSNSISFQPANTILTNLAGLANTNQLVGQSQLIAATNVLGTAAYSNSISFQPANTILTNLAGLSSTNQLVGQSQLIAATNVLGTAAYSNSIVFQPANTILTNLAGLSSTNQLVGQSQLVAATNGITASAYQDTNLWATLGQLNLYAQEQAFTNASVASSQLIIDMRTNAAGYVECTPGAAFTLVLTNAPTSGRAKSVTVFLKGDGTSRTMTFQTKAGANTMTNRVGSLFTTTFVITNNQQFVLTLLAKPNAANSTDMTNIVYAIAPNIP